MYRAQYLITIDYEDSKNAKASPMLHGVFLSLVSLALTGLKKRINKANYKFEIAGIQLQKLTTMEETE